MPNRQSSIVLLRLNLMLAFAEGLAVFVSLLSVTSEEGSAFLLGYSIPRLVLLTVIVILEYALAWLFWKSFRKADSPSIIEILFDRTGMFWSLLIIGGGAYVFLFASDGILGNFASYRVRLTPILIWVGLLCFQSLLVFLCLRVIGLGIARSHRDVLKPAAIFLLLLAGLIAFISLTRIGLTPDAIYWQGAGAPLLFPQVLLVSATGMAVFGFIRRFGNPNLGWLDAAICCGVWTAAVFLWWSQPARTSYNVLEPGPPNFQRYPFGDAILYDTVAHNILTGTPIPNDFWVKPLYSVFLAFLHLFSGENYEILVLLQIIILALIPVLVYLLVSLMGNRPAGLIAALLVILRERNAMALANVVQVSHLKLLLSDVFTMGLVLLLLWLLFRWFERPDERRSTPMLIGGALGLLILTRGHPVLLAPILLAVVFLFRTPMFRERLERAGLFIAGLVLVMIPWLWRIYETTGRVALQSPVSPYSANLAGLYSLTPTLANPEEFTTVVSSQALEESDRQNKQVMDFILQHPGEVMRFVSAHYFHNVIYSYVYLPQSFRIESLRAYVTTEPFWSAWLGGLSMQGWLLLFVNMALIALGIGSAWRHYKFLALVPILIGMGYNASVSVGRISGWRFIQPADWITLVYYSLGLTQLFHLVGFLLSHRNQDEPSMEEAPLPRQTIPHYVQSTGYAILFILLGMVIPYGDRIFTGRYAEKPAEQLLDEFFTATARLSQPYSEDDLADFLREDGAQILYGRAIYPYYIEADRGPINHAWPAYKPRPYNRLVIYLSGPISTSVILPFASSDFDFPDGADAIVLGCVNDQGDMEALSILVREDAPALFLREPFPELTCPFPETN